ncbi:hypothetical protein AJ80_09915 [Polytolypa hystricis UAMH7299]|uniref:Mso1 N-terminal domain-containing protein n=1 Tax=Polytolypa hystricis (strain UAMH7299) TaxID=1447883 RepID=A0A2B7WGI1_POLH7|nr:hypothetical protein AJ80_09915 [Polytolypa hystricis UAMH7299]
MASYFSSFTSSTTITSFSTRFNSLRRAISSGDEVDDPDNEDCSHISNTLRAYYAEKGRRLPPWLPPDPKAPAAAPPVIATQTSFHGYGGLGGGGGGGGNNTPASHGAGRGGGSAGLGDLWGDPTPPSQPLAQTSSLRLGRSAQPQQHHTPSHPSSLMPPGPGGLPSRPSSSTSTSTRSAASFFDRSQQPSDTPPPHPTSTSSSARPLPSQRAGSYQTSQSGAMQRGGLDRTISGSSAQERLRARLHGGGGSPGFASGGGEQRGGYGGGNRQLEPSGEQAPYGGGGGGGFPRRPVGPRGPR